MIKILRSFVFLFCVSLSLSALGADVKPFGNDVPVDVVDPSINFSLAGDVIQDPPPSINTQPSSTTICAENNATFSVNASHATDYGWQVNEGSGFKAIRYVGNEYRGANTANLTIVGATARMNGYKYRVFVKQGLDYVISDEVTLTVNAPPSITTQPSGSTIMEYNNSTFSAISTGATAYQWEVDQGSGFSPIENGRFYSGATTATLNVLYAESTMSGWKYRLVASGPCGSPATSDAATLTVHEALSAYITDIVHVDCHGASTGSATVVVDRGSGKYSYLWYPGEQTTATATGLAAGNYRVTVRDEIARIALILNDIKIEEGIDVTSSGPTSIKSGETTNIKLSSIGTITWTVAAVSGVVQGATMGSGTSLKQTLTGNGVVTYLIKASNDKCEAEPLSLSVMVSSQMSASIAPVTDPICFGSNSGTAEVMHTGGLAPYTYEWSHGAATKAVSDLPAGTHTVFVTDAGGNKISASVVITERPQVTVTSPGYYKINSGETLNVPLSLISGDATATWTVMVKAGNVRGASEGSGKSIVQKLSGSGTLIYFVTPSYKDCQGERHFITVNVDGVAPIVTKVEVPANGTYKIGDPLVFVARFSNDVVVNTTNGTPYIPLTIGNQEVRAAYVSGSGSDALSFQYTLLDGQEADGLVSGNAIVLNDATIIDFDLSWMPAELTLNNVAPLTGVKVDAVRPTISGMSLKGNPGPMSTSVVYIVNFTEPVFNVSIDDFHPNSPRGAYGTITSVSALSGTSYEVRFENIVGPGMFSLFFRSDTDVTDAAGNQALQYRGSVWHTVTTPTPLSTSIIDIGNITCFGTSTGYATVGVEGGSGNYTYSWSEGGSTTATATGLAKGTYAVTVTDVVTNEVRVSNATIDYAVLPGISAAGATTINSGETTDITFTASGEVRWTVANIRGTVNGASGGSGTSLHQTLTGKGVVTYTVFATLNECEAEPISLSITVNPTIPKVTRVNVPENGIYGIGRTLLFNVEFSVPMLIDIEDSPSYIQLTIGDQVVKAENKRGGEVGTNFIFEYDVLEGQHADGLKLGKEIVLVLSGRFYDEYGTDADLTLNNVGLLTGVKVDGVRPTVANMAIKGNPAPSAESIVYVVNFTEPVSNVSKDDFHVNAPAYATGTVSGISASSGTSFEVTVDNIRGEGKFSLFFRSGTAVKDAAGNQALGYLGGVWHTVVPMRDQVIGFEPIPGKTYGADVFELGPLNSTQGLPITYVAADPSVVSISGNMATILKAGSTEITASQVGNATVNPAPDVKQILDVAKKSLTIVNTNRTKIYGQTLTNADFTGSISGLENGDNITVTRGSIGAAATATVAGSPYPILVALVDPDNKRNNYTVTNAAGELTVTAKALTIVNASRSKVYGQTLVNSDFTGSISGLENGDNIMVSRSSVGAAATATVAGSPYPIVATLIDPNNKQGNYAISNINGALTIDRKELLVTADNKERFAGAENPAWTATYSGLVNAENSTVLNPQVSLTTRATISSAPGNYEIMASGAAAANYSIRYQNGTLTIKPGAPTDISLAAIALYENRPAGTSAGSLSSVSLDPSATFTYALVTGTGAADNALFSIDGSILRTTAVLDYEQKNTFSIRVKSTTQYGLSFEKTLHINLLDVNETPTLAAIADQVLCHTPSTQSISLNGISGGPETAQTTTLSVSSSNDNLFESLTVLKTGTNAGTLRYKLKAGASGSANVMVVVQDNGGTANGGVDSFAQTFTVTVNALPVASISSDLGTTASRGETLRLTATGGISYVWANASGIISGQNTAVLTVRPDRDMTYTVTVTNASGCSSTQSISIVVKEEFAKVEATNILTPNGDGKNDYWVVTNIDLYPTATVKIFDRAGRIIYQKTGYDNSWDGRLDGNPLAEGTYYYIIDFGTQQRNQRGFITIVRESSR